MVSSCCRLHEFLQSHRSLVHIQSSDLVRTSVLCIVGSDVWLLVFLWVSEKTVTIRMTLVLSVLVFFTRDSLLIGSLISFFGVHDWGYLPRIYFRAITPLESLIHHWVGSNLSSYMVLKINLNKIRCKPLSTWGSLRFPSYMNTYSFFNFSLSSRLVLLFVHHWSTLEVCGRPASSMYRMLPSLGT